MEKHPFRKPLSMKEQFATFEMLRSLHGEKKEIDLPPRRGKIINKIFRSAVHAVVAVVRLKSSTESPVSLSTHQIISTPHISIVRRLLPPIAGSLKQSLSFKVTKPRSA